MIQRISKEWETLRERGFSEDFILKVVEDGMLEDVMLSVDPSTDAGEFSAAYMDQMHNPDYIVKELDIDFNAIREEFRGRYAEIITEALSAIADGLTLEYLSELGKLLKPALKTAVYTVAFLGGAALVAGGVGGCAATDFVSADDVPPQPDISAAPEDAPSPAAEKPDEKETDTYELEGEMTKTSYTSRFELKRGKKGYLLRAEYTDGEDGTPHQRRAGLALPFEAKIYKGKVIFQYKGDSTDFDENSVELQGHFPIGKSKIFLGGSARQTNKGASEDTQRVGMTGVEIARIGTALKAAIAGTDGDSGKLNTVYFHLAQNLGDCQKMKNMIAFGFKENMERNRFGRLVIGGYPEKSGEGPGYRVIYNTDLMGNSSGSAMLIPEGCTMNVLDVIGPCGVDTGCPFDPNPGVMKYLIPAQMLTDFVLDGPIAYEVGWSRSGGETSLTPSVAVNLLKLFKSTKDYDFQPFLEGSCETDFHGNTEYASKVGCLWKDVFGVVFEDHEGGKKDSLFVGVYGHF